MGQITKDAEADSGDKSNLLPQPAHSLSAQSVIKELGANSDDGLSSDEAQRLLQKFGPNELDVCSRAPQLQLVRFSSLPTEWTLSLCRKNSRPASCQCYDAS
jgi:hypothetical protein